MKFMQRSLMGLFLLSLTLGLLALAAGSLRSTLEERWSREAKTRPARERVFSVNVVPVNRDIITPKIVTFGEIRSRRTLDLRAPVGGNVIFLSDNFIEGGQVEQGELLLRLDPADAQSALDLVKRDAAETKAELREAEAALLLAKDEVTAARAQADLRDAALKRQKNLLSRGVGTEAAVEVAALAAAASNQAILGKRQALAQAKARITKAQSAIARQELRLTDAKRRLADTEVFAEFSGVLSNVTLVSGGLVGPNEKLARLIDPAALEVAFRVSNTQFARLVAAHEGKIEGDVRVRLEILGLDVTATGRIERVSGEVGDGQTGRQIFARLPDDVTSGFRPGDFVTVEADEPPIADVAMLPATAVDASGVVLVLGEGDRLEETIVEVLRKQGDRVIVRTNDLFGREVIEARSPLLGAGIKVKPLRKGGAVIPDAPDMIELTEERRAKLTAFIESNANIPKTRKERILARLKEDKVPAEMVNRIESRMGG
jgi:multidrug resistance efflux pump